MGLKTLICSVCGFETHPVQGCLYVLSVVCCPVGVSAMRWSLIRRPTNCGVSLCCCDLESRRMRRQFSTKGHKIKADCKKFNWRINPCNPRGPERLLINKKKHKNIILPFTLNAFETMSHTFRVEQIVQVDILS